MWREEEDNLRRRRREKRRRTENEKATGKGKFTWRALGREKKSGRLLERSKEKIVCVKRKSGGGTTTNAKVQGHGVGFAWESITKVYEETSPLTAPLRVSSICRHLLYPPPDGARRPRRRNAGHT